jgi:hypothetical protein
MRLSKFSKKWIAYICAIALVVAGFAYAPANTSAAVDPADLDYTMVTAGGNTIGYSIVSNTIVGSTDPWYGDGGVTFQMIYSGDNLAADTTVEINGVETAAGGVVNMIGNGLVKLNPTLMDDDAYTRVDITTTTGSAYFYIKKGDPSGGETTEAPTEAPSVEPTTEAPTEETTEAPTEAPTEETTEAPSEETTEAPAGDWLSAKDRWVLRKDDGSFDVVADGGATYDGFDGIASFYSGSWGNGNVDVKTPASTDPNKLDIRVNSVGTGGWSMQVHINKTGLDDTKSYSVKLTAGNAALLQETITEVTSYSKTVDLANKLSVGETTLELTIEEQTKPPTPVVQDITITPNETEIEAKRNIWASWTNPDNTSKAYVYLEQNEAGYDAMANNGWDFNAQANQPMTAVDNVDHSKNNQVKVEEGETYTFIVVSYDAWNQQTGYGEVEITIPSLTPEEKEAKEYLEKINTTENLALNKTPMVEEGNKEAEAKNFCDGNNGTRWQANKTVDNTWFAVDLGAVYTVDKVLVSWEASNARSYEVYLAGEDGIYDEQPAATVSGLANNTAVYKLSKDINTSARYVKVLVTEWSQNAQDYGISPYELAVFGAETPTESTEAPSVEPSTEAPEPGIDMNIDILSPETDNNTAVGGYTVYSGGWANVTGKAGVDENNSDHIKVVQNTNNNWERWGLQIIKSISGLTAGEAYTVEWNIKADSNDGRVKPDFDGQGDTPTELTGAVQTLTGTVTANDAGVVKMVIGAGNVGYGNAIEYFQPILKDSEGTQVYPAEEPSTEAPSESPTVEPSTEAPSESPTVEPSTEAPTVEPSTEAPTEVTTQAPTQEPTTQAPTQKPTQAPTVKPTTPQPVPVIRIPDKAKVKKAVKKKKSAKKIKVKIKKVKGAKGYQVAVYKTKKKAKKNKKALVKKFTTKTKLTIKSKKFKKKKKLYVKVRAYTLDGTVKVFGAWSKPKKTKKK